ncbi:unnamed protein product [Nesidiocoris tenuis]|uniref:Uncharacterized protein n=1 Tax=Nesidiocoris tenuis TaxID=355587 RepID=A0A6H5HAB6_9HEMI|nr:unnamed protein product [Nesidiocoris tenuis]
MNGKCRCTSSRCALWWRACKSDALSFFPYTRRTWAEEKDLTEEEAVMPREAKDISGLAIHL